MTTILIVEDELDIVLALEMVLQMEGYKIIKASNGKEALKQLTERVPDLIVSDIMMPVLTGLEMLKELQSNPQQKAIPVILMSAGLPPTNLDRYSVVFIKKPFDIDHLLSEVTHVLEKNKITSPSKKSKIA